MMANQFNTERILFYSSIMNGVNFSLHYYLAGDVDTSHKDVDSDYDFQRVNNKLFWPLRCGLHQGFKYDLSS